MKLNGVHWLETQVTGFGNLKDEEKSEIIDFCMLWSFFEGEFLNENAGVISIKEFVRNFEKSIDVVKPVLNDCVSYFRGRYVQDTNFTENYRGLNLSRSGNPAEVDMMLTNDDVSDTLKLTGA